MLSNSIEHINNDLARTKKAIIAIGCSFVQGAELEPIDKTNIDLNQYKNTRTFVNKLCSRYFRNNYTPINFGQEGAGNFAAISRLFLYDIPWETLDEIIVIFMPTGMQRFDLVKDDNSSMVGSDFKTLWPFTTRKQGRELCDFNVAYEQTTYSEKFEVLNFILNFQFLNNWIAAHKAKLIVFPAFSKEFNKNHFSKVLNTSLVREEITHKVLDKFSLRKQDFNYNFLIDQVPWQQFITFNETNNFFNLCYKNDLKYDPMLSMIEVIQKRTLASNEWIMPRGHPSEKGHDLLARKLFEKINAV